MPRVEIVIDLEIDLVPVVRLDDSSIATCRPSNRAPQTPNDACVQSIDGHASDRSGPVVCIGHRHGVNDLRDVTGRIQACASGITWIECIAKYIEALQRAGRSDLRRTER